MRLAILLLLSIPAFASKGVIVTQSAQNNNPLPNTAAFQTVGSFRIEMQFDNYVPNGSTNTRLMVWGDSVFLDLYTTGHIAMNAWGTDLVGPSSSISCTSCRIRAQRDLVTMLNTFEVWDEVTGAYLSATSAVVTSTTRDLRTYAFSIGSTAVNASATAHYGMLRIYSTTVAVGSAPPQRYRTSGYGDYLDFEFEQSNGVQPVDSGPNGVNGNFAAGAPNYATTTVLGPAASMIASTISVKAGSTANYVGAASLSNDDDPALTCAWSTVSSNPVGQTGSWSSTTSCASTTFTATSSSYFGTYNLRLTVTDAASTTATANVKLGSVVSDANDIVTISNASIAQIVGPVMRYGATTGNWNWLDDRHRATIDNQIAMDQRCIVTPKAFFYGTGLNDATTSGTVQNQDCTFTDGNSHTIDVVIDSTGTPDTFKWRLDGGSYTTGVAITGANQTITNGVRITFAATTGHTLNAQWQIRTSIGIWQDYWNVAGPGTVSVPVYPHAGANIITGVGTQFQTDFCGGPGNTTPVFETSVIILWYNLPTYPGQTGRGGYQIASCDSQTQLTLSNPNVFVHTQAAGTDQSDIQYSVGSVNLAFGWTFNNTPGNYYDNVLAIYSLYYRTGIDTYLNFARTMARRWWESPKIDKGQSWESSIQGFFASEPRSVALAGLVLWYLDTGTNIWPGAHHIVTTIKGWATPSGFRNIGELRNTLYMGQIISLDALYNPDESKRSASGASLADFVENVVLYWKLNTGSKTWAGALSMHTIADAGGGVYATVTNGSPNVTITGTTIPYAWLDFNHVYGTTDTFTVSTSGTTVTVQNCNQCMVAAWATNPISPLWVRINGVSYQVSAITNTSTTLTLTTSAGTQTNVPMTLMDMWLWFYNDKTDIYIGGNSAAAVGDTTAYRVKTWTDSTHLVLDRNYEGTSGQKGLSIARYSGFGNQPFIVGLAAGTLAHFVYPALMATGHYTQATAVKTALVDVMAFMGNAGAGGALYGSTSNYYYATGYFNCTNGNAADECESGQGLGGEAMQAYSFSYLNTGYAAEKTAGDAVTNGQWCPNVGSWVCAGFSYPGQYLTAMNDNNYMINPYDVTSNKWVGFFFGYGAGANWSAARIAGDPANFVRTYKVGFKLSSIPNAASARFVLVDRQGTSSTTNCPSTPCSVSIDPRKEIYSMRMEYLDGGGSNVLASKNNVDLLIPQH